MKNAYVYGCVVGALTAAMVAFANVAGFKNGWVASLEGSVPIIKDYPVTTSKSKPAPTFPTENVRYYVDRSGLYLQHS